MPGKRVQFDDATWRAIDLLAQDRLVEFQELAEEAFRDLLKKYGRPVGLRSALRQSVGQSAKVILLKKAGRRPGRAKRP
jgi:hypothetical protein